MFRGTVGIKKKTRGTTGMKFTYKPRPSMMGNQNARKVTS